MPVGPAAVPRSLRAALLPCMLLSQPLNIIQHLKYPLGPHLLFVFAFRALRGSGMPTRFESLRRCGGPGDQTEREQQTGKPARQGSGSKNGMSCVIHVVPLGGHDVNGKKALGKHAAEPATGRTGLCHLVPAPPALPQPLLIAACAADRPERRLRQRAGRFRVFRLFRPFRRVRRRRARPIRLMPAHMARLVLRQRPPQHEDGKQARDERANKDPEQLPAAAGRQGTLFPALVSINKENRRARAGSRRRAPLPTAAASARCPADSPCSFPCGPEAHPAACRRLPVGLPYCRNGLRWRGTSRYAGDSGSTPPL